MKIMPVVMVGIATVAAAAITVAAGLHDKSTAVPPQVKRVNATLPTAPWSYLGVYTPQSPRSFAGLTEFSSATRVKPNVDMYYSGWLEPFQSDFATTAARHGAVPLVQINPTDISLAAIASGRYDGYLSAYAGAVRSYGRPVILSFGHEMNGSWYSWAYLHTSPVRFVTAWRHIVNLFRTSGAGNVTWLWTVNVIQRQRGIPDPRPWWPGSSYVTWVGIDGYYTNSSMTFAPLFGPTIVALRALTSAPILIAETGVASTAREPAQISDLFAGVHTYGLLGLMWFDAIGKQDWRLTRPEAVTAFRLGAEQYRRLAS
jgi:mannan endo-1,4-beta-mannosidase